MWPFQRREVAPAPVVIAPPAPVVHKRPWAAGLSLRAWAKTKKSGDTATRDIAFKVYEPAPGVMPEGAPTAATMAMDSGLNAVYDYASDFGLYTRSRFLGYPYLAQLAQQSEYRRPVEIIAKHMTRKWITLTSTGDKDNTDKLKKLDTALKKLCLQDLFRRVAEQDGVFGRSQLYIDTGATDQHDELKLPLIVDKRKIKKGGLKGIRVIEPFWSYPSQYNSTDPLKKDFYKPQQWFVMGREIHHTRLLTFISREVPDILKPMYAFGGLSLIQMLMIDVENWVRTRQSVSDITNNFSVSGIMTDLSAMLQSDGVEGLQGRAEFIADVKDNQGLLLLDKDGEEYFNSTTPLSSLDDLQGQAQEHMAAVPGIPLIILFGITPKGLNASSDGELQVFADWIHAQQEHLFTPHLSTILEIVQLSEFGEIDPDIGFKYESLQRKDMLEAATIDKMNADTDAMNIQNGVIGPEEAREAQAADEDGRYAAVDLAGPPPPPPVNPADDPPEDDGDDTVSGAFDLAMDDWSEGDHPRADNGEFGNGGGSKKNSTPKLTPTEKTHLSSYSGDAFYDLNRSLRAGAEPGAMAKSIDSAIAKSTIPAGTTLFRGMTREDAKKIFGSQIDRGHEFTDAAFASTSTSKSSASRLGGVTLQIASKQGQHGLDMKQISSNPHEDEVLLPRNTKFRVTGIIPPKFVGDAITVKVEIV